jgi:hypothetical protein
MPTPAPKPLTQVLGKPQEFVVARDGDRDVAFTGWRLSREKDCVDGYVTQCTEVSVFVTESEFASSPFNRIVTHVRRWKEKEQGEVTSEVNKVGIHDGVYDAVEWLKEDNKGTLGTISKKAWVEACRVCPALSEDEVERI